MWPIGLLLLSGSARAQSVSQVPTEEAPETGTLTGTPGKGITFTTQDEDLSLTLRSRIQLRDTLLIDEADEVTNQIQIRTLRLYFQGFALDPDFRYQIQLAFGSNDFEQGSSSPIFDAFVEYVGFPYANVRGGQFFVPFDRARTLREFALELVDRPRIIPELNMDRDVGVAVSSNDFYAKGEVFNYAAGVFSGDGRNRIDATEPGFIYVGRFAVKPFGPFDDSVEADIERNPEPRLMVGGAIAYNQNTDRVRSTTGDRFTLGTVDYLHWDADLVFKFAGLYLISEIIWRKADNDSLVGVDETGAPLTEYTRSGWGWFAQAGYMLTDHLEVAGRYGQLHALAGTDPTLVATADTRDNEIVGGVNYYVNGHYLKAQADYTRAFGDSFAEGDHIIRAQIDASF